MCCGQIKIEKFMSYSSCAFESEAIYSVVSTEFG